MRKLSLEKVAAGMKLAEDINSPEGSMTLWRGTILTDFWLSKMSGWGVEALLVAREEDEGFSDADLADILNMASAVLERKPPAKKKSYELFLEACQAVERELHSIFLRARCNHTAPVDYLLAIADKHVYPLLSVPNAFLLLHRPSQVENYLYRHSIDVAVLAGLMAKWLNYHEDDVKDLVRAGFMHDIGKTQVKFEILSKPAGLDKLEHSLAKIHVNHGYQLLKDNNFAHKGILQAVSQHHERLDGSGYPVGLEGDNIHHFAKILAIVDVYDALTSDRYYKRAVSPFEAAHIMLNDMSGQFSQPMLYKYCDHMRSYFLEQEVRLSNGKNGKVSFFYPFPEMQPIVTLPSGENIDLSLADMQVYIDELIFHS